MDYGYRNPEVVPGYFRSFVCVALALLLGIHFYTCFLGPTQESLEGDFSDIKYVIMQLSRSLADVSRKHDRLQNEVEHMSSVLPQVAVAAGRAKDAVEPCRKTTCRHRSLESVDYDRQVADYALETAGAKIIDTGDTVDHVIYESRLGWALHVLTMWMCRECLGARAMIQASSLPGECWAFKGSKGEATIRLLGVVKITGISIEHIPPHISPTREISSAPRMCQVEGLEFRSDPYPHDFGSFEYDKDGKPIQYFEVLYPSNKGYSLVRLRVLTNWGHPDYTCVYRLRVHGDLLPGQAPKAVAVEEADMLIDKH